MSRLSIEVTPEQHNAIKAMALLEGVNIKEYVLTRLFSNEKDMKTPNKRLQTAIKEAQKTEKDVKSGKLKPYKNAKSVFDRYR